MILFAEDILLEVAARRILRDRCPQIEVTATMGKKGFNYFQSRIDSIRRSCMGGLQFLIFLDGDVAGNECAGRFITNLFGGVVPPGLTIRLAFQEVENWLLCDRDGLGAFLEIPPARLPPVDDNFRDAKECIVRMARTSPSRRIREEMAPAANHTSVVGPNYNSLLQSFIEETWNLERAAAQSESLARALAAIERLR